MRRIAVFILLVTVSVRATNTRWGELRNKQVQDTDRIMQYHQDRLRAAGVYPGSILQAPGTAPPMPPVRIRDFVTIENPPSKARSNYTLRITYQCSQPQIIVVFMDGNEINLNGEKNPSNATMPVEKDADVIFFRKFWPCYRDPVEYKTSLPLIFPPTLLKRPNILMPKAWHLKDVKLKIAMVDEGLWKYLDSVEYLFRDQYHIAFDKSTHSLSLPIKVDPPYSRSTKEDDKCLSWKYEIYDMLLRKRPLMSPHDNVVAQFLKHPVVSPKQQFGFPRSFMRFFNPEMRLPKTPKDPRYTVSTTFYLATQCKDLCSLFQHIDGDEQYDTPAIFLTDKGQIQVQVKLVDKKPYAFFSKWTVPVGEWVRVDIQQSNVRFNVTMLHGKNFSESKNIGGSFHKPVSLDYMEGYFALGGSVYTKNIHGIIGSGTFWRNMLVESDQIPLPSPEDEMFSTGVEDFLDKSKEVKSMVNRRWRFLTRHELSEPDKTADTCVPYFLELINDRSKVINAQICLKESQPLPRQYGLLEKQLNKAAKKTNRNTVVDIHTEIGNILYASARKSLEAHDSIKRMRKTIAPLKQAALLLHGPSCFLLYVVYANGFGTSVNLERARTYLYMGGLLGERMSIKALAYKHFTGEDGFAADDEIAFYYYFNSAQVTQSDRQNHEEGMTEINRVRLTDERQLKQQTAEDEDLFQWFKHQAGSGVQEAKRNLGQLLYWGKQGLKRNLKAAFEYYEQAAQDTNDPDALYDYGITLMKGQGTEADEERAYGVLEHAADVGSPAAVNALGWYYIKKENDKKKAVEYFEKANELNNIDAAYNLGHMHHIGDYPGKKRDMQKAFSLYYKAATQGHVDASVQVSYMFATGIRDYLYRSIRSAIFWSRPITELSPVMGEILREALQSFRSQSWTKSTLLYLAAAETGFEIAGYNVAFLCDENKNKVIREHIAKDCVWRYWNISAHQYVPAPYALNKMGDYYYYGAASEPSLDEAIKYYAAAARMRDPQALFNMAYILEEHGDLVENTTLKSMGLPAESLERPEDTIMQLYQTCSSLPSEESAMPCYMGLIRMKCIVMWKYSSFLTKLTVSLLVIGASTLLMFASTFLRHQRHTDDIVLSEQGTPGETAAHAARTRLIQEGLIEHETGEFKTKSDLEESDSGRENADDGTPSKLLENGTIGISLEATHRNLPENGIPGATRKSDLETESSEDDGNPSDEDDSATTQKEVVCNESEIRHNIDILDPDETTQEGIELNETDPSNKKTD